MPFNRPTLEQLDDRLVEGVESRLPGTDPRLRRSYVGALSRSLAGAHHELYGFLAYIALQAFPDTAESDELERWSEIWGVTRSPAVRATGSITVTGTNGTVIPDGTVWRSGTVDYRSTAEFTIAGGTATVTIEAVVGGAAGNASDGTKMSLVSPIAGIVSEAAADGALTRGSGDESDEALRSRLLLRIQDPPRGGTSSDYEFWARSTTADVTRAWGRGLARGLGTVNVYIMTDDATDDGIPTAAVVASVQAYINARRPVTADVDALAPTAVALDFEIQNLVPMIQSVQTQIEAELGDLIRRETQPGGTLLLSHIRQAISLAAGETDHTLITPTTNVTVAAAEITTLGDVTFTIV